MASYFFDSSGIVKRYVAVTGSTWVRGLTVPAARHEIVLARIAEVEVVSAIARHLPALSPAASSLAIASFQLDCRRRFRFVAIPRALIARATQLTRRHRLRGFDAVQLAALLEARNRNSRYGRPTPILVSSDTELNAAAALEGFTVENPLQHP